MNKEIENIIDNPYFFRWVFKPDEANEAYWKRYMDENPNSICLLKKLRTQLSTMNHTQEKLTSTEKEHLTESIQNEMDRIDSNKRRINIARTMLKYAAVALLFTCIGGAFVFYSIRNDKIDLYEKFAIHTYEVDQPVLIIAEKNTVNLESNKSVIEHSEEGNILLNERKVLLVENDKKPVTNQLIIPYGNRSKATLSDGTIVWLNAGSRLVYPSFFEGKTREVVLYGEAFFEVKHNATQPFIVKTSAIDIKVLGTQFNVSAYPENNTIQTVLQEGSISIRRKDSKLFERDLVLLPNQLSVFNKITNESKVYTVNAADYSLWCQGLMKFDEALFSNILAKIEKFYNIRIGLGDSKTEKLRISGKLDLNGNIDEVLEYLEKVANTNIEKINTNEYIVK